MKNLEIVWQLKLITSQNNKDWFSLKDNDLY